MDGNNESPTYKDVCNGETGHTEVIQIEYDTEAVRSCYNLTKVVLPTTLLSLLFNTCKM